MGWVLRDQGGKVMWMGARALPRLKTSLETEAEALIWAMVRHVSLGYKNIYIESDSQQLMKMIQEVKAWPALGSIIQDINQLLPLFSEATIVFFHRE